MFVSQAESRLRLLIQESRQPSSSGANVCGSRQVAKDGLKSSTEVESSKIGQQSKKSGNTKASKYAEFIHEQRAPAGPVKKCSNQKDDKFKPANADLEGVSASGQSGQRPSTISPEQRTPEGKHENPGDKGGHDPANPAVLFRQASKCWEEDFADHEQSENTEDDIGCP